MESESNAEIVVLDLDWDLIQHLVIPESFSFLQKEQFRSDLIEDELTEKVWSFQVRHHKENREIASPSVVEDEFEEVTIQEPIASIADLIERFRKRYIRNQAQDRIEDLAKMTTEEPLKVGRSLLVEGRRLVDLTQVRGESYGPEDHDRSIREYDLELTDGPGPSFGFSELDQYFHGQKGITVLVAAPKTYKSWVTINAVHANILSMNFPYLYSLELPAKDAHWRLKCMAADIPYWKYLHGSLDSDDFDLLDDKSEELQDLGNYRVEKPKLGERSPQQLVEKAINSGADCVFIDQLQYVEVASLGNSLGALNKTGHYFDVLNEFRNYSDDIPIFIVHQFNRTVMGMDGMPEMQQAKGSSAVEEVATLGLVSWATKDMRSSNILNLGSNLSRHYDNSSWELGVELSRGCRFDLLGTVSEDE